MLASHAIRLRYVPIVAAAFLTACTNPLSPDRYSGICVDENTGLRVVDNRCGHYNDTGAAAVGGHFYMWLPDDDDRHRVPSVGERVNTSHGKRTVPNGAVLSTGLPEKGGNTVASIKRGGLGGKAANAGTSSGS